MTLILRRLSPTTTALTLTAFASCGGTEQTRTTVANVVDSAGVRITVSPDIETPAQVVDQDPLLSIGGAEATGPAQFFQIQGIHLDGEGRIWVADGRSGELRIFLPDGTHWKTRGGRGEGLGEFLRIRLLGAVPGDTVAVGDGSSGRITWYDPDGEWMRTARLPAGDDAPPLPHDLFDDGSILGQVPRVLRAGAVQPGQLLGDTARLVRVDADAGSRVDQSLSPGPLWLWTGRSQLPIPFTINSSFVVVDGSVHAVGGTDWRVRVLRA